MHVRMESDVLAAFQDETNMAINCKANKHLTLHFDALCIMFNQSRVAECGVTSHKSDMGSRGDPLEYGLQSGALC